MASILTDLSKPALAGAVEASMCQIYGLLRYAPQASVHDEPDMLRVDCTVPSPIVNCVVRTSLSAGTVDTRIVDTIEHYRRRGVPFAWTITPSTRPESFGARLQSHGFVRHDVMPGMAVDLAVLPESLPCPADVTIGEVQNEADLREWAAVCAAGFEMDHAVMDVFTATVAACGMGERAPVRCFTAFLRGAPAACSALFPAAGVAGIYMVATLPEARRRGLGALVTAHPLQIARRLGYRAGVLQASEMGEPVYRRLGFKTCCEIAEYTLSEDIGA